jgi:hypothetical protein
LRAVTRAERADDRALRAGFDRWAFAAVVLPLRTSLLAPRFTSLTAVSVPLAIAFCAASAFAAIAPRVDPIDSATLTRRSCDLDEATAGLLKLKSTHAASEDAAFRRRNQIEKHHGNASRCGDRLANQRT